MKFTSTNKSKNYDQLSIVKSTILKPDPKKYDRKKFPVKVTYIVEEKETETHYQPLSKNYFQRNT